MSRSDEERESRRDIFSFASDTCKQLITLSTAVLTISITFAKDVLEEVSKSERNLLSAAWLAFLVSILFGVWTLLALTGSLASDRDDRPVFASNVRIPAGVQVLSFLCGLVLTVLFGINAI